MCLCLHLHAHVCAGLWRPRADMHSFPLYVPRRQGLSLNLGLAISASQLASLPPPSMVDHRKVATPNQPSPWGPGSWTYRVNILSPALCSKSLHKLTRLMNFDLIPSVFALSFLLSGKTQHFWGLLSNRGACLVNVTQSFAPCPRFLKMIKTLDSESTSPNRDLCASVHRGVLSFQVRVCLESKQMPCLTFRRPL